MASKREYHPRGLSRGDMKFIQCLTKFSSFLVFPPAHIEMRACHNVWNMNSIGRFKTSKRKQEQNVRRNVKLILVH